MKLIKNGKLTVSLFHGTSTLFTSSIARSGLGARNVIDELKVIPFLKLIYELCVEILESDIEWQDEKCIIKNMIKQQVSGGGFNFRHGSTYLTPSKITAVGYASSNKYGSEAISYALKYYEKLKSVSPESVSSFSSSFLGLLNMLNEKPKAVLIEIKDAEISGLLSERGADPLETVLLMETMQINGVDNWQQCNFEVIKPIESSDLKFYEIRITENDRNLPKYEFFPYSINF